MGRESETDSFALSIIRIRRIENDNFFGTI
jgi:hypothetical protein